MADRKALSFFILHSAKDILRLCEKNFFFLKPRTFGKCIDIKLLSKGGKGLFTNYPAFTPYVPTKIKLRNT